MEFSRIWWLAASGIVVLLAAAYVAVQYRTRVHTLRFAQLEMLERIAPKRPKPYRHAGFVLMLLGMLLLIVGLAGPTGAEKVPRNRATVMLAIDVSLSMQATDVEPDRLTAAQEAATQFVDDLTPGVNLGLISFAGIATVLVSPTTDREPVRQAIATLKLDERTATGEAIISALQTIDMFSRTIGGSTEPVPARIVLMTDGKRTVGRTEHDAADRAKQAGIPVSVIAFGTNHGTIDLDGTAVPVPLDTEAMRDIARISGGDFHTAHTAAELKKVYAQLGEQIGYETVRKDVSYPWMVAAMALLVVGTATALATSQRIP